jgi:outer membrane protein
MGRGAAWRGRAPGVLAALLALAAPAAAQDGAAPTAPRPVNVSALGHDDALRLAAERNLALLARALDPQRAEAEARAARRAFVPELGMVGAVRETLGQERRALEWIPSITYGSWFGTAVRAEATVVEGISGNPESTRTLFVEVSQALLRGSPFVGAGAALDQADVEVEVARQRYRAELLSLLERTDRAYWDLVFAREDVDIKRRGHERARVQFEETTENIRRGLLAPGDIFVVEESVVDAEERLSRAEETRELATSALRELVRVPPELPVVPATPAAPDGADPADAESSALAASKHPEVVAARLAAQQAKLGVGGDTSAALPAVDAFGSLAVGEGEDFLGVPVSDDPELRAGLRLAIPLTWGPDSARVTRARTAYQQRLLELADAERAVTAGTRDAATRLRGRRKRLELAARIVDLAQKKLDNEKEKYRSGLSTLVDVVRFQRELDEAASSALRARVELLTARTAVLAARGDLDEAMRIVVR